MCVSPSNIMICADKDSAGLEVAERFICAALRSISERGAFHVVIPGGSSPVRAFEILAGHSGSIAWDKVHVFFSDERCVPPDDADSNYRQAHALLLSKVPIPESNVHRFLTEFPPDDAAYKYEQELHRILDNNPFDLVILGMGPDGHTASLFPATAALHETHKLAVANWVEKLNAWRLTLTIPALCNSREVLMLAFGNEKSAALSSVLHGDYNPDLYPAQAIKPSQGRLVWVVDGAAAKGLA